MENNNGESDHATLSNSDARTTLLEPYKMIRIEVWVCGE
jgi:hypothetical protein